jgi:hypothetical protein
MNLLALMPDELISPRGISHGAPHPTAPHWGFATIRRTSLSLSLIRRGREGDRMALRGKLARSAVAPEEGLASELLTRGKHVRSISPHPNPLPGGEGEPPGPFGLILVSAPIPPLALFVREDSEVCPHPQRAWPTRPLLQPRRQGPIH